MPYTDPNNYLGGQPFNGYIPQVNTTQLGYGQTQDAYVPNNSFSFSNPDTPNNPAGNTSGGNTSSLAAGNLVGGAIGAYEFFHSQKALNELNKTPYPNYTVAPQLQNAYSRAEGFANQGFTGGEKTAYQNNINQQGANAYNRAIQSGGGNLSNDISAGINSQQIAGENQFSIADANLHRQNMAYSDSLASQIQAQQNMATAANIRQREQQQNAWSQSSTAGLQSFVNSFNISGLVQQGGGAAATAATAAA